MSVQYVAEHESLAVSPNFESIGTGIGIRSVAHRTNCSSYTLPSTPLHCSCSPNMQLVWVATGS